MDRASYVRPAVTALGKNTNRFIRDNVLNRCHGAEDYKEAWKTEVKPRLGKSLPEIVPDWQALRQGAFPLRHQVIHGLRGMPSSRKTSEQVEVFVGASKAIGDYAHSQGIILFGKRLPVRKKPRP